MSSIVHLERDAFPEDRQLVSVNVPARQWFLNYLERRGHAAEHGTVPVVQFATFTNSVGRVWAEPMIEDYGVLVLASDYGIDVADNSMLILACGCDDNDAVDNWGECARCSGHAEPAA